MKAQVKLGRVFGVELGLHFSWIVIALLITFSLAAHFHMVNRHWSEATVWAAAILTGLLFFAGLFAHELSHAVVAKSRGIPIRGITLFALGGVAQIEKEAGDARTEFVMGIIGPITSAVLGLLCLAVAVGLGWAWRSTPQTPGIAILVWLGYINLMLAAFNMIPGFPLDGGRVLRAIIWGATHNGDRATLIAARVGQIVALLFIAFGIFEFFAGAGLNGIWLAFIGWFLLQAAGASRLQLQAMSALRGLKVGDTMTRDCVRVDGNTDLQTFVDSYLLRTGQRCFIVVDDGYMAGLLTPHEVRTVERARWPQTPVREIMRPVQRIHAVGPEMPLADALEIMGREDVNQLPVVQNGNLQGVLSRGNILRVLQSRAELGGQRI